MLIKADQIISMAMPWDVMGGVGRRAWARNENSITTSATYNKTEDGHISLPFIADETLVAKTVRQHM